MQRDTLVGIAWAVGLLLLMGGVFAYEVATFELDDYAYAHGSETVTVESGSLAEGEAGMHSFEVPANATRVVVTLSWNDADGDPDTFAMTLKPAAGDEATQESSSEFALSKEQSLPGPVGAVDEAHALEQADLADWGGTWQVTVSLTDAPGTTLPIGMELQADGNQAYDLTIAIQTLSAAPA